MGLEESYGGRGNDRINYNGRLIRDFVNFINYKVMNAFYRHKMIHGQKEDLIKS